MSENSSVPTIIKLAAPLSAFMPVVDKPQNRVSFKEKCLWTVLTLTAYLICCQIPLYGIIRSNSSDPFYWFRTVIASNRGTLMELGITPIVTSSMLVQFLVAANLIKIDSRNRYHRSLFASAQKVFAVVAILLEAYLLLRSGLYGSLDELGYGNTAIILTQLFFAGIIVLLFDEMLENGYGLGSGISLFIATNVCENFFWKAFSPTTIHTAKGMQFEGAFVELVRVVSSKKTSLPLIWKSVSRQNLPSVLQLSGAIFVILVALYLRDLHTQVPLTKRGVRGVIGHFPVRILSASTFPIILQSTIVTNINMISRILFHRYSQSLIVNLIGRWSKKDGYFVPIGGLAYYLHPVTSLEGIRNDPLHFILYLIHVCSMCGLLSVMWLDTSGATPQKIARQLDGDGIQFQGKARKDTLPTLQKLVIPSAVIGGVLVGLITVLADIISFKGSGSGILLAVNLVYGYFEKYRKMRMDR